jgi:hypothetical protein
MRGHAVAQLVEALRYKPEGRGFDSRWCHWIFFVDSPSGRTLDLRSTHPLTEMSRWGWVLSATPQPLYPR